MEEAKSFQRNLILLKILLIKIDDLYIPTARKKEFDQDKADKVIEQMMNGEEIRPIQIRQGDGRFVLVKGIHRLEAAKSLGDVKIKAYLVGAKQFG
jgi:ParB-like chromosome segregation protein Spo0J